MTRAPSIRAIYYNNFTLRDLSYTYQNFIVLALLPARTLQSVSWQGFNFRQAFILLIIFTLYIYSLRSLQMRWIFKFLRFNNRSLLQFLDVYSCPRTTKLAEFLLHWASVNEPHPCSIRLYSVLSSLVPRPHPPAGRARPRLRFWSRPYGIVRGLVSVYWRTLFVLLTTFTYTYEANCARAWARNASRSMHAHCKRKGLLWPSLVISVALNIVVNHWVGNGKKIKLRAGLY